MKKSMRKNVIVTLSIVMVLCISAMLCLFIQKNLVDAEGVAVISELKEEYAVGDKLTISSGATIEDGGKTYTAKTIYLVCPDGSASTGTEFTLSSVGKYKVVLEGTNDAGNKISASKTFLVNKPYYSLSSNGTIAYDTLNSVFAKNSMASGLKVQMSDGETLTFAEPINVFSATDVEILTFNLMTWTDDVEFLTITLTDCYNPDIALEVNYWVRYWNESSQMNETYTTAGQKGYTAVGLTESLSGTYTIEGAVYSKAIFGASTPGNRKKFDRRNNFTLIYETAEDNKIRFKFKTPESTDTKLITEINNDKLYSNVFPGFTNGDVFVSITTSSFKNGNEVANVEIGKFNGKTLSALDKFTDGEVQFYHDETAPIITIDADDADNKIASGVAVKIPSAEAIDESGLSGDVSYSVWYNYGSKTQRSVGVSNGTFTPTNFGGYTIEYSATDTFGNRSIKTLTLSAVEKKDKGIDISVTKLADIPVGSSVSFADYTIDSYCKDSSVKITLKTPSGEVSDITKSASSVGLYEVGEYEVIYDFEDAYYSGSYSYKFNTAESDVPVFEKTYLSAPKYFIVGAIYSIENVKAYKYGKSGKTAVETEGYISYDNGEYKKINAEEFVIESGSTAKLKLICKDSPKVFIESSEAKIVSVKDSDNKMDITKYFVGDIIGTTSLDYTTYTSTATSSGNLTIDAVNPILSSSFAFTFAVAEKYKITEIEFLFADYYNIENTASVKLLNEDSSATTCSINGVQSVISKAWTGSKFTISSDGNGNINFGSTSVTADLGLSSELCFFTIIFKGVATDFKFDLYTFCNQTFGKVTTDNIKPMISADDLPEVMEIDSVISTSVPSVADVLSPNAFKYCLVSVGYMDDDGNYSDYKNADGVAYKNLPASEIYQIKLDKYGSYTITYKYTDGNGKEQPLKRIIYVNDNTAPTISFENVPSGTIKVGLNKAISRIKVVVSDNYSEADDIEIYTVIRDARGRAVLATKEETFTITEKGTYTVRVRCTDKAGNFATISYNIYAE